MTRWIGRLPGRAFRFLCLPSGDRRLVIEVAFMMGLVRTCLWLLPFRSVLFLTARLIKAPARAQLADEAMRRRIAWAITLASRCVPTATCLAQALTAKIVLARRGQPADLQVGVSKDEAGRLQAHAWVISEGQIITGALADLADYRTFPSLDSSGTAPGRFPKSSVGGPGELG